MRDFDHNQLFNSYLRKIINLNIPNPKFYITFSAVPSSGKTTIAKFLARKLKGLYLSADEVRATAKSLWPDITKDELERLIVNFTPTIQNRLMNYPNKLHIVDTNIDRYYENVFKKVKELKLPLYIVRIDIPKKILIQRASNRDKNNFQNKKELLSTLDEKRREHSVFLKKFRGKINFFISSASARSLNKLLTDIKGALKVIK